MSTTNIRLLEEYLTENKQLNYRVEAVKAGKLRKKQEAILQQQATEFDPLTDQSREQ